MTEDDDNAQLSSDEDDSEKNSDCEDNGAQFVDSERGWIELT